MEMNAKEARDRCLDAILELEDVDDQRSLWRAAGKYNRLAKEIEASAAQVIAGSPLAHGELGSFRGRD